MDGDRSDARGTRPAQAPPTNPATTYAVSDRISNVQNHPVWGTVAQLRVGPLGTPAGLLRSPGGGALPVNARLSKLADR